MQNYHKNRKKTSNSKGNFQIAWGPAWNPFCLACIHSVVVLVLCLRVKRLEREWWIDLPELTSIRLGRSAFEFDRIKESELTMRSGDDGMSWWIDLPKLTTIIAVKKSSISFCYLRSITLESSFRRCESLLDIPSLTEISLPEHALKEKKRVSITGSPTPCNSPNQ